MADSLASSCSKYYEEIKQEERSEDYPKRLAGLEYRSKVLSSGMFEFCLNNRPMIGKRRNPTLDDIKRAKNPATPYFLDLSFRENLREFLRGASHCASFIRRLHRSQIFLKSRAECFKDS